MLQKELAKRLKARYDTKMDGNGWLEVSSDGIPLCRIKYNCQFLSNADQNLSDEYRSKIADIQEEISTVREYVGLYEHAPQMKAADVSDYRQLAAFGDTVLAATYSEKNGFMEVDCDIGQEITAYIETWFDADKKFGIDTASEDGTWLNMYAKYNPFADTLRIECEISRDSGSSYFDYEPTENESQLIKDMIAEKLMQTHGQTPQEFCEDVGDITMGGMTE